MLETNKDDATKLDHNRDINGLKFYIENVALSNIPLIQNGWVCKVSEDLLDGYFRVDIITWKDLNNKYNIVFDTLVIDCF